MPNEIIIVRPPAYTGDEAAANTDGRPERPEEFQRFEELTKQLVNTPKPGTQTH
jgi:hypothetical protein